MPTKNSPTAAADKVAKTNGEIAVAMARGGLPVFPCRPQSDARMDPETGKLEFKDPYCAGGFLAATRDEKQIRTWWAQWPNALIGVPTGKATGFFAVDIDPSGAAWHVENSARISCGRTHQTMRGHHLLYSMPQTELRNSASKIAPGVDLRAEGGYIIWWPAHGLPRVGDMDDLSAAPTWLLETIASAKKSPAAKPKVEADGPVASIKTAGGARHGKMLELAAVWRGRGNEPDEILTLLWDYSARFFDPPHNPKSEADVGELRDIAFWFEDKETSKERDALEILTTVELRRRGKLKQAPALLEPVLPKDGSMMIYGSTGVGKSHLGLCIAGALALNQPFLDWLPANAIRVLYVDGEMALDELTARIEAYYGAAVLENLEWVAARAGEDDLPNLADVAGQELYLAAVLAAGVHVVVFDNLSCLRLTSANMPENSTEAWQPVGKFIRRLNRLGVTVIIVHHANKAGGQRGSTDHVGPMDTVIKMEPVNSSQVDPLAENDVNFTFEKHRRFGGEAALPFRAKAFGDADGRVAWTKVGLDALVDDVVRLHKQGCSVRDIADSLKRSKNGIQKAILRAKSRGLILLKGGLDDDE